MPKQKKLPTTNPIPYCDIVRPILEMQRIRREEIPTLECRSTHVLKSRSVRDKENDNLYSIYGSLVSQNDTFMHNAFHAFHGTTLMHKGGKGKVLLRYQKVTI